LQHDRTGDLFGPGNWLEADRYDPNSFSFCCDFIRRVLERAGAGPAKPGRDWTVEKRSQDNHCNASRGYKDKEDENRDYVIVLPIPTRRS